MNTDMTTTYSDRTARLEEDGTVSFGGREIGNWALDDDRLFRFRPLGSMVWTVQADQPNGLCTAITALSLASDRG